MGDLVPLVSVLTSATVAVSVPFLSARLERARSSTQLRLARLEELRSVMDAASLAFAKAEEALGSADLAVEHACKRGADPTSQTDAQTALARGREAVTAVHQALHRTAVRLGWTSSATALYAAAHKQLEDELRTLQDVFTGGPSADSAEDWSEVTVVLHEIRGNYQAQRTEFYEAIGDLIRPTAG